MKQFPIKFKFALKDALFQVTNKKSSSLDLER